METDTASSTPAAPRSPSRKDIKPSSGLATCFTIVAAISLLSAGISLLWLFSDDPVPPTLARTASFAVAGLSLLAISEILTRLVDIAYSLRISSGRSTRDLETDPH